jgi:hypothetical protein
LFTEIEYFEATDNFNSGGTLDALPSNHSFSHTRLKFGSRYQWQAIGLYSGLGYGSTDSKQVVDGLVWERTNANLTHLFFGLDYLWSASGFRWLTDFDLELPLPENNYVGTIPPVYDSAISITPRLVSLAPGLLFGLDWAGYFGLKYHVENLGSPLVWGTSLGLNLGRIYLRSSLEGFENIFAEPGGIRELERSAWHCRASGCAKKFDAYNPSVMKLRLDSELRLFESWAIGLGLDYPLLGKNNAHGITFRAGLTFGWGGYETPTAPPRKKTPLDFEPEQETDVDHRLFRTPPLHPPAPQRRAPRPPPIDINRELRETEMQIELKRAPPKNQPLRQKGR